jgi:fatty acid-binding protein DegV
VDLLVDFVKGFGRIKAVAIEDATTPEEVELLARRLKDLVPAEHTYRSKVSPVVGAHVGPHVLAVSVLEAL